MNEIINDLYNYSTDGVISVKVVNDLLNRAFKAGFTSGRREVITIVKELII